MPIAGQYGILAQSGQFGTALNVWMVLDRPYNVSTTRVGYGIWMLPTPNIMSVNPAVARKMIAVGVGSSYSTLMDAWEKLPVETFAGAQGTGGQYGILVQSGSAGISVQVGSSWAKKSKPSSTWSKI